MLVTTDPPQLTKTMRALIGDIIMLGAEIDELASVALFLITNVPIANGFVLFDKTPVTTKLKKLQYFVELSGRIDKAEQLDEMMKKSEHFIRMRNTFAHGTLSAFDGITCSFTVSSDTSTQDNMLVCRTTNLRLKGLHNIIEEGHEIADAIRDMFDASLLHERSEHTVLATKPPTPKELRKARPAKPQRPPRSSPA